MRPVARLSFAGFKVVADGDVRTPLSGAPLAVSVAAAPAGATAVNARRDSRGRCSSATWPRRHRCSIEAPPHIPSTLPGCLAAPVALSCIVLRGLNRTLCYSSVEFIDSVTAATDSASVIALSMLLVERHNMYRVIRLERSQYGE